jgi:tryptophan synthase alpha chain
MNAVENVFRKKQPFVGFVVAGDGGVNYCVDCCLKLIEGGIDILEIGFPFTDPVADGPIIQRASQRALERGTTSSTILEIARRIKERTDIPLILFSYYNPVLKRGDAYLRELKSAGFDAVLIVDLPPSLDSQNSHPYFTALKLAGLYPIFLVSPSTDEHRLMQVVAKAEGFLYYACQKGTTGIRNQLPDDISYHISRLRQKSKLPIAVGFGIADRGSAKAVLQEADGFVVGSAFVNLMEQQVDPVQLKRYAESIDPRSYNDN